MNLWRLAGLRDPAPEMTAPQKAALVGATVGAFLAGTLIGLGASGSAGSLLYPFGPSYASPFGSSGLNAEAGWSVARGKAALTAPPPRVLDARLSLEELPLEEDVRFAAERPVGAPEESEVVIQSTIFDGPRIAIVLDAAGVDAGALSETLLPRLADLPQGVTFAFPTRRTDESLAGLASAARGEGHEIFFRKAMRHQRRAGDGTRALSVLYDGAGGRHSAVPEVLLDGFASADHLLLRLDRVETLARANGEAIAVMRPTPGLLDVLTVWLGALEYRDLDLVPLSILLEESASEAVETASRL